MKRTLTSLLLLAAILAPGAASACRMGEKRFLFTTPPPHPPADAIIIRGHFSNAGVRRGPNETVGPEGLTYAGDLTFAGPTEWIEGREPLRVYAGVTSCTLAYFWKQDGDFYLVGRMKGGAGDRWFAADSLYVIDTVDDARWDPTTR